MFQFHRLGSECRWIESFDDQPVIAVLLLVFILHLLFDYSKISEPSRLQYSSQVVLVSSPNCGIRGVSCRLGVAPMLVEE